MADIPMSRMDDEGIEQTDELTAAIAKARGLLTSAAKSLKKVKNKGLADKADTVLDLATKLLEQITTAIGNPWAIATLVEDFENHTVAIRTDLHQALEAGDLSVTSVSSLMAQISEIGNIARGL